MLTRLFRKPAAKEPVPGAVDQWASARRCYQAIIDGLPDRALSDAQKREISDYAGDHFGDPAYAPWLETYAAWRGAFVPGCLPDEYYGHYVTRHATMPYRGVLPHAMIHRLLPRGAAPDVGYLIGGALYSPEMEQIPPAVLAESWFRDWPYIYLKQEGSLSGQGVERVPRDGFTAAIARSGDAVLQSPVISHPVLRALSPDAAATIRVTTVLVDGRAPVALPMTLRMGRKGVTHCRSGDMVSVCIDTETGRLSKYGFLGGWIPTTIHPDTGVVLAEHCVPHVARMQASAVAWHRHLPQVKVIGWDVSVDPEGNIQVFEANIGHNGIKLIEAEKGPNFAQFEWDRLHLTDT